MTAAAQLIKPSTLSPNLRPLDPRRDLLQVADLVELCFADTLDSDGRRYIHHLRSSAYNRSPLAAPAQLDKTFRGFVWEEDQRVVGNLNMISVTALRQKAYLFANVAVHPDYRQRGIARALTQVGLDFVRSRRVRNVWLQVNAQNPAAIHLYKTHGFGARAVRATWHNTPRNRPAASTMPGDVQITALKRSDWSQQYTWLRRLYPGTVRWYLPINFNLLRPGLSGAVRRMISDGYLYQWAARQNDTLLGTLAWQSSNSQADMLWLTTAPEQRETAVLSLLTHIQQHPTKGRTLAVNFPAGQAADAFVRAGFHEHNTLIWMHTQIS